MIADCTDICCLAVGPTATWALTSEGVILVRKGMGPDCPQGTGWLQLDISQLGQDISSLCVCVCVYFYLRVEYCYFCGVL